MKPFLDDNAIAGLGEAFVGMIVFGAFALFFWTQGEYMGARAMLCAVASWSIVPIMLAVLYPFYFCDMKRQKAKRVTHQNG